MPIVEYEEMWKVIPGFEDYAISSYGNVMNRRLNHLLAPIAREDGFRRVGLRRNGVTHYKYVHRLVAENFISGWEESRVIGWRDRDRRNNRVTNLYFKGMSGLGALLPAKKEVSERRIEIVETGRSFMSVQTCAQFLKTHPSHIYKVLRGERYSHLGYTFRWINI